MTKPLLCIITLATWLQHDYILLLQLLRILTNSYYILLRIITNSYYCWSLDYYYALLHFHHYVLLCIITKPLLPIVTSLHHYHTLLLLLSLLLRVITKSLLHEFTARLITHVMIQTLLLRVFESGIPHIPMGLRIEQALLDTQPCSSDSRMIRSGTDLSNCM